MSNGVVFLFGLFSTGLFLAGVGVTWAEFKKMNAAEPPSAPPRS